MSKDAFSLVKSSRTKLSKTAKSAAANKKLTPHDELMQHRVTPETKLPPLEFLFKMNGIECFPLSELVANTGKAKSGKTLFLSIVMACCMKRNVLGLERIREAPIRVLWYDTEQSAQSTQNILVHRIIPLSHTEDNGHTDSTDNTDSLSHTEPTVDGRRESQITENTEITESNSNTNLTNPTNKEISNSVILDPEKKDSLDSCNSCSEENSSVPYVQSVVENLNDQFFVFNVRGIGWEKRRELLTVAISEIEPDLVIVDGIKDLITDINDGTQATMVVEDQMGLAQTYNCCIVDVLHQNKSDTDRNMRGWIGTELANKAFEAWACSIVPNTETFKVEHVMSRMRRCQDNLYYQLDDAALPISCEKPDEQPREPNGRFASKKKPEEKPKPKYDIDWGNLNREYILQNDIEEPLPPEEIPWDLVKLFTDAMEGCAFKRYNQLMAIAMRIAGIDDSKYYYFLIDCAKEQHIIVPGKDGYNQQGFFLNSAEQRQRILAYEEEQRRKAKEPVQSSLPFPETDTDDAPPY